VLEFHACEHPTDQQWERRQVTERILEELLDGGQQKGPSQA
jgi:hypothetical protein